MAFLRTICCNCRFNQIEEDLADSPNHLDNAGTMTIQRNSSNSVHTNDQLRNHSQENTGTPDENHHIGVIDTEDLFSRLAQLNERHKATSEDLLETGSQISDIPVRMFDDQEVTPVDVGRFKDILDPQAGKRKLEGARALKPDNIDQANQDCENDYKKRYTTEIGERRPDGYYKIQTFVRREPDGQYPYACYTGYINPEKGIILLEQAFRDIPSPSFEINISVFPGKYDKYAEFRDTKDLSARKILYNWIREMEEKSKLKFQLNVLKEHNIDNDKFIHDKDYITPIGGINFSEVEDKQICRMVFEKKDDGYHIIVGGTPIGLLAEMLGVYHLNREVTKIIFDRVKKLGNDCKYNLIYKYSSTDS
jgi:hypothetical protein